MHMSKNVSGPQQWTQWKSGKKIFMSTNTVGANGTNTVASVIYFLLHIRACLLTSAKKKQKKTKKKTQNKTKKTIQFC